MCRSLILKGLCGSVGFGFYYRPEKVAFGYPTIQKENMEITASLSEGTEENILAHTKKQNKSGHARDICVSSF